ncbi:MAG: MFS transporter [Gammaproteobacteria bacterium]|nr:MFS transporter [Gammaproteobacteria bacterium]NKB64870.1 MFS transporter [Gammaproteobacteria bacterium]
MKSSSRKKLLGGIADAFSDRNFRIHSVGAIASWISFFVQIVAVSWMTWEITQSTTWLAIIALLDILPNILLLPLGGALADRFDRYKILLILNPLMLIQALILALLGWSGSLTIWSLAILVLVHGLLLSFYVPAMHGVLPRFIAKTHLASAIAVNSAYTQFAVFAGPAIAGWIISSYSIAVAFIINVVGYLILFVSLLFLRTPPDYTKPETSSLTIRQDITEGFSYLRGHRGIFLLLVMTLWAEVIGSGIYHMAPAYSAEFLNMGVEGVSLVLASFGIGATISALWLARGGAHVVTPNNILWSFLAFGLSIGFLFLFSDVYLIVVVCVLVGIAGEIQHTGTMSLIQLVVDENKRGRVMGNLFLLQQIAAGIGTYFIGAIASSHGLAIPMLVMVFCCLLAWIFIFTRREALASALGSALDPNSGTTAD